VSCDCVQLNSTQAFSQLAQAYDRARPSYPEVALERITQTMLETQSRFLIADIGAGTGIFTRQLRQHLPNTVGIFAVEPGHDMSAAAQQNPMTGIEFLNASAEALPFSATQLRAITVAQAIQWFDRPAFFCEAARVLEPAGLLFVVQNNRNWQASPFLEAYEGLLEQYSPNYNRHYRDFDIVAEVQTSGLFAVLETQNHPWVREMSAVLFRDMTLSSTKMKAAFAQHGLETMTALVDTLTTEFFPDGATRVDYLTEVYVFQKG
jgi:ubiquinone/menaquinone biosynthesis C-methylase UbiE